MTKHTFWTASFQCLAKSLPTIVLGRILEFGGNFQRIQGISKESKDLYNSARTYYYSSKVIWEDNVIPCKHRLLFRDAYMSLL